MGFWGLWKVNWALLISGEIPVKLSKSEIQIKISGFFPVKLGENLILRNYSGDNRIFSAYFPL